MDKERRDELRSHLDSINWPHSNVTYGELRALLDMADERDRYRALLIRVQMNGSVPQYLYNEIDAALEGK